MPVGNRFGGVRAALTGRRGQAPLLGDEAGGSGQRVVTVLGMHRSGTSSLVGSLEAAGLPLGDVRSTGGESNEKGHREPGELIALHDDVLITSGGAWHLPPRRATWTAKHRGRRDEFIAARRGLPLWGWKEPRTLLVIEGWLEVLPALEMVGTFRNPAVVALSLQRRHGSETPEMWLRLWLAYNERLLALVEERGFALIDFDLPPDAYEARLEAIIDGLGLARPGGEGEDAAFFDASLRTSQKDPPAMALPREVERAYARLRETAERQAAATAQPR